MISDAGLPMIEVKRKRVEKSEADYSVIVDGVETFISAELERKLQDGFFAGKMIVTRNTQTTVAFSLSSYLADIFPDKNVVMSGNRTRSFFSMRNNEIQAGIDKMEDTDEFILVHSTRTFEVPQYENAEVYTLFVVDYIGSLRQMMRSWQKQIETDVDIWNVKTRAKDVDFVRAQRIIALQHFAKLPYAVSLGVVDFKYIISDERRGFVEQIMEASYLPPDLGDLLLDLDDDEIVYTISEKFKLLVQAFLTRNDKQMQVFSFQEEQKITETIAPVNVILDVAIELPHFFVRPNVTVLIGGMSMLTIFQSLLIQNIVLHSVFNQDGRNAKWAFLDPVRISRLEDDSTMASSVTKFLKREGIPLTSPITKELSAVSFDLKQGTGQAKFVL